MGRPAETQEEFISKSKRKFGDTFDYCKVKYKNSRDKVILICRLCKFEWSVEAASHLRCKGCPSCVLKKSNLSKRYSNEEFLNKARKIHKNQFEYLDEYTHNETKIRIKCLSCGNIFLQSPYVHLKGKGCKPCSCIREGKKRRLDVIYFENLCSKVHSNRYEYFGDYQGQHRKMKIRCKACDNHFMQVAYSHCRHKKGCPYCNFSWGELRVKEYLAKNSIIFELQKTFPECKNKKVLRFDFYIPSLNMCVEYDGELHYLPVKIMGGARRMKQMQKLDKIKTKYCKDNNIKLLRIPFWEYDNIETILKDNLK